MYKLILFVAIALLSVYLISGCSGEEKEAIRIGATMSETGAYATQGIAARNGYLLCQEHINEEGGLLGRPLEFVIYDDESNAERAPVLYEKLITEDLTDLIIGPYGSTLTEAVAPVTERHRMVHISPLAATSSIWEQGREYLFMVLPPAELFLSGLIELAAERELKRVAVLQEDALFPRAAGNGAASLARDKELRILMHATYPSGTEDFGNYIREIEREEVEVLAMAASNLDDFIKVTRQLKEAGVHVQMFGTSGSVQQFQDALGDDAEYVFGLSAWEPGLDNPGIGRFTDDYRDRFGMEPSFHAAGAYGSCELLAKAVSATESLEQDALRDELLSMRTQTVFSSFEVDERGYQIANSGLFIQWQDGRKVVVWPDELAESEVRYPVPAWDER